MKKLILEYNNKKEKIKERLKEFEALHRGKDEEIFTDRHHRYSFPDVTLQGELTDFGRDSLLLLYQAELPLIRTLLSRGILKEIRLNYRVVSAQDLEQICGTTFNLTASDTN